MGLGGLLLPITARQRVCWGGTSAAAAEPVCNQPISIRSLGHQVLGEVCSSDIGRGATEAVG